MTLLSVRALSVSLGEAAVLTNLDLEISAGTVVGLIGPNGAGKTTLLRAIAGLLPLDRGDIHILDRPQSRIGRRTLAKLLAYLPQGGQSHWSITVETLVMLARLPHRSPWTAASDTDRAAVTRALEACDLVPFRHRPMSELSGGERARALLARALAGEPKLLLADEPAAGLDPGHQLDVMTRFRQLAASGAGVIVVMHDLTLAARFCDRLVLLDDKQVASDGDPDTVLSPAMLARCYGVRGYHGSVDGQRIVVPLERMEIEKGSHGARR